MINSASLPISSLKDIVDAFENATSVFENIATSDWVNSVDPETMSDVKALYRSTEQNCSLYNVFCAALKYAQRNNIRW